jgi:putative MATE family efflux protein
MKDNILRKSMFATLISLALPSIIEQLLATLMQYIDTAMVGNYGTSATSAVGLSTTINWLINSPISAAGLALLVMISTSLGENQTEKAHKTLEQANFLVLTLGVTEGVIALVCAPFMPIWMGAEEEIRFMGSAYFAIISLPMVFRCAMLIYSMVIRATGDSKTPMIINIMANILNVILNAFFIYPSFEIKLFSKTLYFTGFGLGAIGAGIATALSTFVAGSLLYVIVTTRFIKRITFMPNKHILKECSVLALPLGLTRVVSCFGYVTFAGIVSGMGTSVFAAHSIATTAESLFYIPGYGMQNAASTLSGYSKGKQDFTLYKKVTTITIVSIAIIMTLSGTLLFVFAENLMKFFSDSEEVIRLGSSALRIVSVSEPIFGIMVIMQGLLNGLGMTRNQFVIESVCMWAVRILPTYMLINHFDLGLNTVWLCMVADNACKFIATMIIMIRIHSPSKAFRVKSLS